MVNPFYADKTMTQAFRKAFRQNKELPQLALGEFLERKEFIALQQAKAAWKENYVPDRHRFDELTRPVPRISTALGAITKFIDDVTGKKPISEGIRQFHHQSFTLMHDKTMQKPAVVAYYFLDEWNEEWGGQIVFFKNGKTLGSFTPRANTLLIVERRKGVRSFVKYVNHKAGKRSFRVLS
jgi:hypothetical protein